MYSFNAEAPTPSRSNGSFTLGFGVISIPLARYAGSEEVRVVRKEFINGDVNRPAGRLTTDKNSNTPITDEETVVRMAAASDGTFVALSDDEIAERSVTSSGVAEIISFVPWAQIGEYLPEDVEQVRPRSVKGKANPVEVKAYSLFLTAMVEAEVVALIRYGTKVGAQYGLLTHNGDLIKIKTADQIRQRLPMTVMPCTDAEKALAGELIKAVGIGSPVVLNETAVKVQEYVDAKAASSGEALPPPDPATVQTLMSDLTALLAQSIAEKVAS